jgi:hypothetical protein
MLLVVVGEQLQGFRLVDEGGRRKIEGNERNACWKDTQKHNTKRMQTIRGGTE